MNKIPPIVPLKSVEKMHKKSRSADLIWYLSGFIYKPRVQHHASVVIIEVYLSVSVHKSIFFFLLL